MVDTDIFRISKAEQAHEEWAWVARSRNQDETAMSHLVGRHRSRLIRTAANLLRDRYEAEDVAQESFLKAFRELHRLREDKAFSGYLYRICVRLCMDRLRLKRAEPAEIEEVQPHEGLSVETKVVIEKILSQLPYDLRATLVLREMEQLSYDEVAECMHVPIGTVRSRLHSARERFRKLWLEAIAE